MPRQLFRVYGGEGNRSGYGTRGDVLVNELNDGVSLDDIWNEINDALSAYNEQKAALAGLLSYRTTNVADVVAQGVANEFFEEATEFGVPRGISDPTYLSLGYSFKDFDIASRFTWKYLRAADSEQVRNRVSRILAADNQLVNGSILQRLLDPAVRTNDWGHNVYGLYNGDLKPPDHLGKTFTSDHKHYLCTESTVLDAQDVEAAVAHIREHGYGATQAARFVLLVNPADAASAKITSWRAGVEYRTGGPLPAHDFIPSSNAPAYISAESVHGATPPADYNGMPVNGSYAKALIIESYFVPAGYAVVAATGGPGSESNPVGLREHQKPQYQGLRVIPGHWQGYPLIETFFSRGFGTGVRHRGAAVAIQITTNTTYTPPVIQVHR